MCFSFWFLLLEVCLHGLQNSKLDFPGAKFELLTHQTAHLHLETSYGQTTDFVNKVNKVNKLEISNMNEWKVSVELEWYDEA